MGYEAMVDHLRAYRNPLLCHITFREESDIIPVYPVMPSGIFPDILSYLFRSLEL